MKNTVKFNGNISHKLKGVEKLKYMYEYKFKYIGEEFKDLVWLQSFENFYNAVTNLPNYTEESGLAKIDSNKGYCINNMKCTKSHSYKRRDLQKVEERKKEVYRALTPYEHLIRHINNYGNTFINVSQFNELGKKRGLDQIAHDNKWKFTYKRVPNGYIVQS